MWDEIEFEIGEVPANLKNILKATGYDRFGSLARLHEEDIDQIELFVRSTLKDILSEDELKDILGIFSKQPDKFQILPGHRKILFQISEIATRKQPQVNGVISGNERARRSRTQVLSEGPLIEPDAKIARIQVEPDLNGVIPTPPPPPISEENLEKVVEEHRTKIMDQMHKTFFSKRKSLASKPPEDLKLRIFQDVHKKWRGKLTCWICDRECSLYHYGHARGSGNWLVANFVTHFDKHQNPNCKRMNEALPLDTLKAESFESSMTEISPTAPTLFGLPMTLTAESSRGKLRSTAASEEERHRSVITKLIQQYFVPRLDIYPITNDFADLRMMLTQDGPNKWRCKVVCWICLHEINLYHEKRPNGTDRWLITNFVQHFALHKKRDSSSPTNLNSTNEFANHSTNSTGDISASTALMDCSFIKEELPFDDSEIERYNHCSFTSPSS